MYSKTAPGQNCQQKSVASFYDIKTVKTFVEGEGKVNF